MECVFWRFLKGNLSNLLGYWLIDGCNKDEGFLDVEVIVCCCNYFIYFGIFMRVFDDI